jgi:hypothetical protein
MVNLRKKVFFRLNYYLNLMSTVAIYFNSLVFFLKKGQNKIAEPPQNKQIQQAVTF